MATDPPFGVQASAARREFAAERDVPAFQAQLTAVLTAHGIALDDTQVAALVTHYRLLGEANTRLNLTRLMTPEDAVRWHYLDILAALPCFTGNMPNCWVDVGSGGGFPGLVLAVARPDWRLMLAERRAKKAAFLRACVAELGLSPRVLVYAGEFEPGTARRALVSYGVDVSRETCGIVARAVEDGRRRLPQLLKLPILVRAVFWLGAADATALVECPPQGWMVEHLLPLPTGDRRTALALTRRAD